MRCVSAEISQCFVQQPRFPFDWCQMNPDSMKKVIELEKENVKPFWSFYFSEIDDTCHHKRTGSWFPHDVFTPEEIDKTIAKYTRRTIRFLDVLESEPMKIFLIVFGFPEENSSKIVNLLYHSLSERTKSKCFFLVGNALISEEDVEIENMHFFYAKLDNKNIGQEDWKTLIHIASEKISCFLQKKGFIIESVVNETP